MKQQIKTNLEQAAVSRDRKKLLKEIRSALQSSPTDKALRYYCIHCLISAGMHKEAYVACVREINVAGSKLLNLKAPSLALLFARTLNLMGASNLSYQIIKGFQYKSPEDRLDLAIILFRNFKFKEALQTISQIDLGKLRVERKIGYFQYLIELLFLLDRFDEAHKIFQHSLFLPHSQIDRAHKELELAKFWACKKRWKESEEHLSRFERCSQGLRELAPRYYFVFLLDQGWIHASNGKALLAQDKFEEARKWLHQALSVFEAPLLVRWAHYKHRSKLLSEEERRQLSGYPGLNNEMLSSFGGEEVLVVGSPANAEFVIYPDAQETIQNGRPIPFVATELRLLGLLRQAGEWGLEVSYAKSLLWPENAAGFFLMNARIDQLQFRLRKRFGFEIESRRGSIYLSPNQFHRVSVVLDRNPIPPLIRTIKEFSLDEIENYYGVSRTYARTLCARWIKSMWIAELPNPKNRSFRTLLSTRETISKYL